MKLTLRYSSERSSDFVCTILTLFASALIVFAFIASSPAEIARGSFEILRNPAGLISDYIKIGSIGGAFLNSGILMLLAIWLLRV